MLSFELSAIDIILVLSVMVLFVLYWTKLSKIAELPIKKPATTHTTLKKTTKNPEDYTECPRGFGYIQKIGDDGSVSDRCLGCYKIMDCYGENEKVALQLNQMGDTNNR